MTLGGKGLNGHATYVENPENIVLYQQLKNKLPNTYIVALVDGEGKLVRDNDNLVVPVQYLQIAEKTQNVGMNEKPLQYFRLADGLSTIDSKHFPYSIESLVHPIDPTIIKPHENVLDFLELSQDDKAARRFDKILQSGKSFVLATHTKPYGPLKFRVDNFMEAMFADGVITAQRVDAAKAINAVLGVEENDDAIKKYADVKEEFAKKLTTAVKKHENYKPDNLDGLLKQAKEKLAEQASGQEREIEGNNPLNTYKSHFEKNILPTNNNLMSLESQRGLQSSINDVVVKQESPVKLRLVDLADPDKRRAFTEALSELPDLLPKEPNAQVDQANIATNANSTIFTIEQGFRL